MQDIPLSYSSKPASVVRKSRFNDPVLVIADMVGYYKRVAKSVVFIPIAVNIAKNTALTEDMFFEGVDDLDDKKKD